MKSKHDHMKSILTVKYMATFEKILGLKNKNQTSLCTSINQLHGAGKSKDICAMVLLQSCLVVLLLIVQKCKPEWL